MILLTLSANIIYLFSVQNKFYAASNTFLRDKIRLTTFDSSKLSWLPEVSAEYTNTRSGHLLNSSILG